MSSHFSNKNLVWQIIQEQKYMKGKIVSDSRFCDYYFILPIVLFFLLRLRLSRHQCEHESTRKQKFKNLKIEKKEKQNQA